MNESPISNLPSQLFSCNKRIIFIKIPGFLEEKNRVLTRRNMPVPLMLKAYLAQYEEDAIVGTYKDIQYFTHN